MAIARQSLPPPGWGLHRGLAPLLEAFPRGELSEIVGRRSSGGSSLLLALLARALAAGAPAALVDAADAFDPAGAAAAGADLRALLWVRCGGQPAVALRAVDLLARCPGFAVVALDLGDPGGGDGRVRPAATWLRLRRAVEGSPTVLALRTPERLAGSAAALVLSVERVRAHWAGRPEPTRLDGLLSEVRVLRSRGPAGRLEPGRSWTILWRA